MTTAFFTDERFAQHNQPGHPEHAGRLTAIMQRFEQDGVLGELKQIQAAPVSDAQLLAVHAQRYLTLLEKTSQLKELSHFGLDTYVVPQSYELARLAVGGLIAVVDAVMQGEAQNGLATIRPPGHHATPDQGMGFCLLSNVAIAARHAITAHHLQRIAIVDYDVHHGNGTQDCLYADPQVLFISSHQSPLYPGTGAIHEIGIGTGKGYTLNAPLPPGTGDSGFKLLFEQVIIPRLHHFQPELIIISAGFDAHWSDPLAHLQLTLTGYDFLAQQMIKAAETLCNGKIVFAMEGGYDLNALSYGWLNIANALLGKAEVHDPMGASGSERPLPTSLLETLIKLHNLG